MDRSMVAVGALILAALAGGGYYVLGSGGSPALSPGTTTTGTPETPTTAKPGEAPAAIDGGSGATLSIERPVHPTPENIKPIDTSMKRDYVCSMQVNEKTSVTALHLGGTYHFCSEACKQKFEADPALYLDGGGRPGGTDTPGAGGGG